MIINTIDFAQAASVPIAFSDSFQIPKEYNLYDVGVTANIDVSINGELSLIDGYYIFRGHITTVLPARCDRCLKSFEIPLDIEVFERFQRQPENLRSEGLRSDSLNPKGLSPEGDELEELDEAWQFSGNEIDFEPAMRSVLLINLPFSAVCQDDCKGMCATCGHDLNLGQCSCDKSHIDPRFEGLLSLFQDKEV